MTNSFCPFLKETCKGNECVMFRNEECLLVSFFKTGQEVSEPEGIPSIEAGIQRGGLILRREEAEVPDWMKKQTPEELAVEMLDFIKKECPKDEGFSYHTAFRYFWENRGVQEFLLPPEARLKIQRAQFLAEKEIMKQQDAERKRRLLEEKDELPSLVGKCVDWARENGLKRVILSDADTFLLEKDLDLLHETKRALYSMVNLMMKSKK